jgi:uncharacterized protein (TIGR03437 family)
VVLPIRPTRIDPILPAGQIAQSSNSLALPVTVTIGSQKAAVTYTGLVSGVVGLYQFNVVVPTIPTGTTVSTIIFNQGTGGQSSLTLAVQ